MSRKIFPLSNLPQEKSELINKFQVDSKDIFKLQFSQLCEIIALIEILQKPEVRNNLLNRFDTVEFHNGKGPDIKFSNSERKESMTIEIKGSLLKRDYMNKGKYSKSKEVKFWGNGLKKKDFSEKTGALVADIVILVCCAEEDKKNIDLETKWDFIVFDNSDIQKLEPKSTIFFPTYCITTMVNNGQSFFTDEYSGLHKGLVQLIKFNGTNNEVETDFKKVWKDIDCFLYQNEHKKIVKTIWEMDTKNMWDKLKGGFDKKTGKFQMSELIKTHVCGLVEMPKDKHKKLNCIKCKEKLNEIY